MKNAEKPIWRGKPSQLSNVSMFLTCFLFELVIIAASIYWKQQPMFEISGIYKVIHFGVFLIPFIAAGKVWLVTYTHSYELNALRFIESVGILNRVTYGAELYLVQDTICEEPLHLRVLGLGNVILFTMDVTSPVITIKAVPNAPELHQMIRSMVEDAKEQRNMMYVG